MAKMAVLSASRRRGGGVDDGGAGPWPDEGVWGPSSVLCAVTSAL
jgi:hypothetical protein